MPARPRPVVGATVVVVKLPVDLGAVDTDDEDAFADVVVVSGAALFDDPPHAARATSATPTTIDVANRKRSVRMCARPSGCNPRESIAR
jgi:hypothetical protein